MKTHLIARKNIMWVATETRLSDNELEYFKGILSGPTHEVDVVTDRLKDDLELGFKKLNPTFHNAEYDLVIEK